MARIYRLLSGPDTSEFCHKVTKALNEGWHLHGSPAYAADPKTHEMRCAQAIYKDVDEEYHPGKNIRLGFK